VRGRREMSSALPARDGLEARAAGDAIPARRHGAPAMVAAHAVASLRAAVVWDQVTWAGWLRPPLPRDRPGKDTRPSGLRMSGPPAGCGR